MQKTVQQLKKIKPCSFIYTICRKLLNGLKKENHASIAISIRCMYGLTSLGCIRYLETNNWKTSFDASYYTQTTSFDLLLFPLVLLT